MAHWLAAEEARAAGVAGHVRAGKRRAGRYSAEPVARRAWRAAQSADPSRPGSPGEAEDRPGQSPRLATVQGIDVRYCAEQDLGSRQVEVYVAGRRGGSAA